MSDYLPPGSEMHINQMPEECLRTLFSQLPVETQFEVGNVCRQWRTVRDALFRIQKSLEIKIGTYINDKPCLIIAGLNAERTAFLVAMFPSLTELTIFSSNQNLFEEPVPIAHLLAQYRNQLVTLKLKSEYSLSWEGTLSGTVFIDAINTMSKLKQLTLYFELYQPIGEPLAPFDLPILRLLDKLDFVCPDLELSILTLWLPHLEARSTPMEISLNIDNPILDAGHSAFYDSITPKVASMFIHFPKFYCDLQSFQRLSTRFINLTELSLVYHSAPNAGDISSVPALMKAIANLKHLAILVIHDHVRLLNLQPSPDRLPQLPTVVEWYLTLYGNRRRPFSHNLLSAWTTNLGWLFPNLQYLSIILDNFTGCTDCDFDCRHIEKKDQVDAKKAQVKDCLRRQLRHIKQQGPKLSTAEVECIVNMRVDGSPYFLEVKCTLEDLAD